uniref:Annexin n=1 Tax=Hucho hucho TaxID=62062 RepID=A0A4W5NX07_9TELE
METDITAGKMEVTSQMFGKSKSKPVYYGTVAPYPHLSASGDAAALEKAIEAKGVDEDMTMTVLVKRSNGQRQQFKIVYEQSTGPADDLKSALSDLKDVVLALNTVLFYIFTTLKILASRSNEEIRQIKRTFMDSRYKCLSRFLLENTRRTWSETSGDFTPAILALLRDDWGEDTDVDIDLAKNDARALFEARENTKGTDVAVFIDIPAAGAAHTFQKYSDFSDVALPKALDLELKGDIEDCLIDIDGVFEFETMYKRTLQEHMLVNYTTQH